MNNILKPDSLLSSLSEFSGKCYPGYGDQMIPGVDGVVPEIREVNLSQLPNLWVGNDYFTQQLQSEDIEQEESHQMEDVRSNND